MAQTWAVIRGDIETVVSGGALSYRVSASGIGAPPKRNLSTRGPFQQGETFYAFRYEKRIMTLVFHAEATSLALADTRRDDIYNLWKGIEGETVTIKVARDDGMVRLIDGEVVGMVDFPESIFDRFGAAQSFAVQVECDTPFWRKSAVTVVSLTINGTTTIPYNGQIPAEPIINIVGPIANPVLTQITTGKKIDFTGTTIASGDNYQVDTRYGYKTVLDGSSVNRIANLTNDSDLADFYADDYPDTITKIWSAISAPEANAWYSVAYGNDVWVAVSSNGTNRVMRSTDGGANWTAVAAAEANPWRSVAYGNGVWVAVSSSGTNRVMRSTNGGVTWSAVAAAAAVFWNSVAYGNGVWVAVAGLSASRVMRSTDDGATWAAVTPPSGQWYSVAYGNGVWVAVSISGGVMRSTDDGVTWSAATAAAANTWFSVAYGNNVWVAVSTTGTNRVMRSTDNGVTWFAVAAAEANLWTSVAYDNGVWVAVAQSGTNRVMRSTDDGVTWSAATAAAANTWFSVAYGNNVWVAVSTTGTNRVMRSTDVSQNYTLTGTGTDSNTAVSMTYNELYLGI